MVRQLSLYVWCDLCPADDRERAIHVNLSIAIGGLKPRTLDLCQRHHKELLGPVLDALSDHGEKAKERVLRRNRIGNRRDRGPFRCKVDGCAAPPLKHYDTLRVHLERLHEITIEEYIEAYGELVQLTPQELDEPAEIACEIDDCGKVYSTALGHRWPHAAMVTHMRGTHGLKWKPGQPFSDARRIG